MSHEFVTDPIAIAMPLEMHQEGLHVEFKSLAEEADFGHMSGFMASLSWM